MEQQDNKQEQLSEDLIALFLLILSYKNDREFKRLLSLYKQEREVLKNYIGKVYLSYIKGNELKMTHNDVNREVKKLEPLLKKLGYDLKNNEDILLDYLLYKTYKDTYIKTDKILNKYIENAEINSLSRITIDKAINKNIEGMNVFNRNKQNKVKLINKLKDTIKSDLIMGKSIELINKDIDKRMNEGVNISDRLIQNEIVMIYNESVIKAYKDNGITKVIYSAIVDDRTSIMCQGLDGQVFNIGDAPIPILDTHINCRSTLLPYIE